MFKFNHTPGTGFSLFCLALVICHTKALTMPKPYMDLMNIIINRYRSMAITKVHVDIANNKRETTNAKNITVTCGSFWSLLRDIDLNKIYKDVNDEFQANPVSDFTTLDKDLWFANEARTAFYTLVCFLLEGEKIMLLDKFTKLRDEVKGKAFRDPTLNEVKKLEGQVEKLARLNTEWENHFTKTGLGEVTRIFKSYGELLKRLVAEYKAKEHDYKLIKDYSNDVPQIEEHVHALPDGISPHFTVKPNKKYKVRKGADLNIPCEAEGSPLPSVKWQEGGNIQAPVNDVGMGRNILQLSNIHETRTFWCIARNSLGYTMARAVVQVKG